jgi:hypothetical protein
MEESGLDLSAVDAAEQQMVDGLNCLAAEVAVGFVLQVVPMTEFS